VVRINVTCLVGAAFGLACFAVPSLVVTFPFGGSEYHYMFDTWDQTSRYFLIFAPAALLVGSVVAIVTPAGGIGMALGIVSFYSSIRPQIQTIAMASLPYGQGVGYQWGAAFYLGILAASLVLLSIVFPFGPGYTNVMSEWHRTRGSWKARLLVWGRGKRLPINGRRSVPRDSYQAAITLVAVLAFGAGIFANSLYHDAIASQKMTITLEPNEGKYVKSVTLQKGDWVEFYYDSSGPITFRERSLEAGEISKSYQGSAGAAGPYRESGLGTYEFSFTNPSNASQVTVHYIIQKHSPWYYWAIMLGVILAAVAAFVGIIIFYDRMSRVSEPSP